jgi:hypothetical protein
MKAAARSVELRGAVKRVVRDRSSRARSDGLSLVAVAWFNFVLLLFD